MYGSYIFAEYNQFIMYSGKLAGMVPFTRICLLLALFAPLLRIPAAELTPIRASAGGLSNEHTPRSLLLAEGPQVPE